MLKIKKVEKIISILFFIYLAISFTMNITKVYKKSGVVGINEYSIQELREEYKTEYNEMTEEERKTSGMEPIENLSDEEIKEIAEKNIKQIYIVLICTALFETFIKNVIVIIIFVVVKMINRRFRKEKLNKDDFYNSKEYYRDILEQSGICEIAWIDSFKLQEKDIIAEILQLENKKIISIDNDRIVINKDYDVTKIKMSQQYILENIRNGKLKGINEIVLKEKVKEDALQDGLIKEKNDLKNKQIKQIISSVIIFGILNTISNSILIKQSGNIPLFLIAVLASIAVVFYPIVSFVSFIATTIKYKTDPYFRTEKGNELNRRIEGLKRFLKDYTMLDKQDKEGIILWEEYLVYSVLFDQNKRIIDQYKRILE